MNAGDCDDSNHEQSHEELQQLRQQVRINGSELTQIVMNTDHFIFKIRELNEMGVNHLGNQEFQEALVCLQEAQKLLEYGAHCGKTIDRLLIIFTLQNQACSYQRLWELEKASNYMEAIIFNMESYLRSPPTIIIDSQIYDSESTPYVNLSSLVTKRLRTAHYYLKYSALNSQMEKHQKALNSAIDALIMMKHLCQECFSYERYIHQQTPEIEKSILKELSTLREQVEIEKNERYVLLAKKSIKRLKFNSIKPDKLQQKELEKFIQFNIIDAMQIDYVYMNQLDKHPKLADEISHQQKIYKAIYISIAFFTIANELRLLSHKKYSEELRKSSKEFKKSELYHLNAVIVAAKYSPCEGKYLSHVLKSYKSHYQIDLTIYSQESQETTNQTDFEGQPFILTPAKPNKYDIEGVTTRTKFQKGESLVKINEFQTSKLFPKIPMLHLKKKKKKVKSSSKSKKQTEKCKHVLNLELKLGKKDKKKSILRKENMKNERTSFNTNRESMNKNKSNSRSQSKKQPSIEPRKKKTNRLNEEYFRKPSAKKPKPKLSISNSLTKGKTDGPFYSPRTPLEGKKVLQSQPRNNK